MNIRSSMTMKYLQSLALGLALLLLLPSGQLEAQSYDFTPVTRLLSDSVEAASGLGKGYGMILMQEDVVIYEQNFGESHDLDRVVPIASASKWLSGATIMTLVDDGLLSLDDTLGRWWPDAPVEKRGITIRQLFSHTAGWGDSEIHNGGGLTMKVSADSIVHTLPLEIPAGSGFTYGGVSMQVAGRIAELVTGQSWSDLFAERITTPLGMTKTFFGPFGTENPQVAGSGRSSGRDYLLFLQMIARGGTNEKGERVLSRRAIDTMLADQTGGAPIVSSPQTRYGYIDPLIAVGDGYGIGLWRETMASNRTRRPDYTSPGAFGFAGWIDRERRLIGVFSVLSDLPNTAPTFFEAKRLIREVVDGTTSVEETTPAAALLDIE